MILGLAIAHYFFGVLLLGSLIFLIGIKDLSQKEGDVAMTVSFVGFLGFFLTAIVAAIV